MNHSFVAQKGDSVLRVEYISESWGEIKTLEITTKGETPTLRYNFRVDSVEMSSGTYTAIIPLLAETMHEIAGAISHRNDIVTIFTNKGWKVVGEK